MKIGTKLKNCNVNKLQTNLENLQAKIGFFGGRYYSLPGFDGLLSFKSVVRISRQVFASSADAFSAKHLVDTLKQKDLEGMQALDNSNWFQQFCTRIKQFFGNLGFNKAQALQQLSDAILHAKPPKSATASSSSSSDTPKPPAKPIAMVNIILEIQMMQASRMNRKEIEQTLKADYPAITDQEIEEAYAALKPKANAPIAPKKAHPLQDLYKPHSVTIASGDTNQRTAGEPNGCTRFAAAFLTKPVDLSYTAKDLTELLHRKDLGIIPGKNDFGHEVVTTLFGKQLQLVDTDGNKTTDSTPLVVLDNNKNFVTEPTIDQFLDSLEDALDHIIQNPKIDGLLITSFTESFALRFCPNRDVEFFDPHGDSKQESAAAVWTFKKTDAAHKITYNIFKPRIMAALMDVPQVEFTPVIQKYT